MSAPESARPFSFRQSWLKAVEARIEGQVVEVTASMYGRVDRVLVTEDQSVEKGDLLVELDHRELDRRVEAAVAELDRAVLESMAADGRPGGVGRRQSGVLSRVEFASSPQVARARGRYLHARLNRLNADVRAPVAGRVIARSVQPRDYAALAQRLVSVLDSDDLWVLARFGAQDFDRLRAGQSASVSAGGRLFAATVAGLNGPEEPALLEFIARPVTALRPGMMVAVAVAAAS
jgi:multidrug resistance efflux pump